MMKKHFFLIIAFLSLAGSYAFADDDRAQKLRVVNWAEYLDEKIISEFESWYAWQTGEKVIVEYKTFSRPEDVLDMIEDDKEDFDVFCGPDYIIERMLNRNLLLKIDTSYAQTTTPNWTVLTSPFIDNSMQIIGKDKHLCVKDYAVGYLWGNTGVLYNKNKVEAKEVGTWDFLFNSKYNGKIRMKDSYSDICTVLLTYAYRKQIEAGQMSRQQVSSDLSNENLAVIDNLLTQMKPQIGAWESTDGPDLINPDDFLLAVTWNGDARSAIDTKPEDIELGFAVPEEGSNYWIDCWVIPVYAGNKRAASYWIDFLCKPQNAVRCMQATGYATAIATRDVMLAASEASVVVPTNVSYFFGQGNDSAMVDPIVFPDSSVIGRCAIVRNNADRQQLQERTWQKLKHKAYDPATTTNAVLALLVVAALLAYLAKRKFSKV